ncbi:MAG: hypothetical protein KDJ38_11990 [Gammaproteobacteria bacterium]|nr:hypothetical protein [Gammaproteobacteria bacterium]
MTEKFIALSLFLISLGGITAFADNEPPAVEVTRVSDLQADAGHMTERQLPMVVEMAADGCTYCLLIEEKVLQPMILSGDYEDKALLRKLYIDDPTDIRDFDGSPISQSEFARRYKVSLTPTLLFLDHTGKEIAPRMTGVPLIDFYGLYLDGAIDQARSTLGGT